MVSLSFKGSPGPGPSTSIVFAPGALKAAAVEAMLALQKNVTLLAGTYTLDRPLALTELHSNSAIVGTTIANKAASVIVPGWAHPSTSLADDPTNTFISVNGTIDTSTVNTYLNAVACAGSQSITLHSAVTVGAGTWLVIEGNNFANDELQGSTSGLVILRELVQVASDVSASVTIPLKWATAQHHSSGTGITVKGIRPVTNFKVEGIIFDPGNSYIATGITANYIYGLDIAKVSGGSFTYSMLRVYAAQNITFNQLHDTGGGHGIVYLDSVQRFEISKITSDTGARYIQPYGVPRAKLLFRNRATNGGRECRMRWPAAARSLPSRH